jgi:hypothetical protein
MSAFSRSIDAAESILRATESFPPSIADVAFWSGSVGSNVCMAFSREIRKDDDGQKTMSSRAALSLDDAVARRSEPSC